MGSFRKDNNINVILGVHKFRAYVVILMFISFFISNISYSQISCIEIFNKYTSPLKQRELVKIHPGAEAIHTINPNFHNSDLIVKFLAEHSYYGIGINSDPVHKISLWLNLLQRFLKLINMIHKVIN